MTRRPERSGVPRRARLLGDARGPAILIPSGRLRLGLGLAVAVAGPVLLSVGGAVLGFPRVAFPTLLFLLVVVTAVWLGRLAAGLLAAALSSVGLALFVFPPFGSISEQNVAEAALLLLLFLATALLFAHLLAAAQTARAAAEAAEDRFRVLLEGVRDYAIFMLGRDGRVVSWNAGAESITGYRADEILGEHFSTFYVPEDVEREGPAQAIAAAAQGRVEDEGWRVRKDGSRYWAHTVITALHEDSGGLRGFANVIRDMTDRKRAEEQLAHLALHDALTGLPNRALILDRVASTLASGERRGTKTGLLFVDLDRFKLVNDSLGHDAGDELLIRAAAQLGSAVRTSDTVGRLGGDEFAVVCPDVDGRREALAVGERVRDALEQPFSIHGREVLVTASIGVAVTSGRNRRARQLVAEADSAMYAAKRAGRNRVVTFDERMLRSALDRLELGGALRHALTRGELAVLYQPQLDLRSGAIAGAEALVHWRHPEHGALASEVFVPIAEDVGLAGSIDAHVFSEAYRVVKEWNGGGASDPVVVSLNLSPLGLTEPDFVATVARSAKDVEVDLSSVCLEITEASLVEGGAATTSALGELKALGVRLALDDFGTGYSSLSYLAQLPLDVVKVDASFVRGLAPGSRTHAILGAICSMARALDLVVIGAGVETAEELAELRALDFDVAQGSYVGPPQTAEELAGLLAGSRGRTRAGPSAGET